MVFSAILRSVAKMASVPAPGLYLAWSSRSVMAKWHWRRYRVPLPKFLDATNFS